MRSVGHGFGQFEEQRLVGYKDYTGALQPLHRGVGATGGRKQQFLDGEDIEPEIEQAKARLQDADIGFTARDNDLLLLQALEIGANGLLLGEIEEALLEQLCGAAERRLDTRRHRALSVDRALERADRRNAHIGEKPREARHISAQSRAATRLELRQKIILIVDDRATTLISEDALCACHGATIVQLPLFHQRTANE